VARARKKAKSAAIVRMAGRPRQGLFCLYVIL